MHDATVHVQSWTGLLIIGLVFVYHYLVTDPKLQRALSSLARGNVLHRGQTES